MSETVSLCSVMAGERRFGIDTRRIEEVLDRRAVQRVPLAPGFVGGIFAYRGEVLTAVSLRAVLGMTAGESVSCLLVLEGEGERFGLMVDAVSGIVHEECAAMVATSTTVDEVSRQLFAGCYRMSDGLLVQLMPERLCPVWLHGSGLLGGLGCAC